MPRSAAGGYRLRRHGRRRYPREIDVVIHHAVAVRLLLLASAVVDEDEVKVRTVAKFEAPEFPVGDDREPRFARTARLEASRFAVLRADDVLGDVVCVVQESLGNIGQLVADFGDGKLIHDVAGGDPQDLLVLEIAQSVHHPLDVVTVVRRQQGIESFDEFVAARRGEQLTCVEQFVE